MVKIRLRRTGKKKQPSYRIVVADARAPRDGKFLETIGYYAPLREPSDIMIDKERAIHWLSTGAQPTKQVLNLFKIQGIWDEFQSQKKEAKGAD